MSTSESKASKANRAHTTIINTLVEVKRYHYGFYIKSTLGKAGQWYHLGYYRLIEKIYTLYTDENNRSSG